MGDNVAQEFELMVAQGREDRLKTESLRRGRAMIDQISFQEKTADERLAAAQDAGRKAARFAERELHSRDISYINVKGGPLVGVTTDDMGEVKETYFVLRQPGQEPMLKSDSPGFSRLLGDRVGQDIVDFYSRSSHTPQRVEAMFDDGERVVKFAGLAQDKLEPDSVYVLPFSRLEKLDSGASSGLVAGFARMP